VARSSKDPRTQGLGEDSLKKMGSLWDSVELKQHGES